MTMYSIYIIRSKEKGCGVLFERVLHTHTWLSGARDGNTES